MKSFKGFKVQEGEQTSLYIALASIVFTAFMVQPTLASLIVCALNAGAVFLLRMVAHAEGAERSRSFEARDGTTAVE